MKKPFYNFFQYFYVLDFSFWKKGVWRSLFKTVFLLSKRRFYWFYIKLSFTLGWLRFFCYNSFIFLTIILISLGTNIWYMRHETTTINTIFNCIQFVDELVGKGSVTLKAKGTAPWISPIRNNIKYSYLFNFHFSLPTIQYPIRLIKYVFNALPRSRARMVNPNSDIESDEFVLESIEDSNDWTLKT